jgi:phosphopantetheinyl transferase
VDVEMKPCSVSLAKRHFLPQELEQLPEDGLTRLWAAKEAFSKAIGRGLTVRLDSFEVCLHPDSAELKQTLSPLPYRLHEYKLGECRMCLCCTDERPEPEFVKGSCTCGADPV